MLVLVTLIGSLLSCASGSFTVNVADSVIVGKLGSSVVLPCWVTPPQDVGALEVRWYRPDKFNSPVLFYRGQKVVTDLQEESYRNRSSLTLRDAQSGGLKVGDVSLRLENLGVDDEGVYHCYVSGDTMYDSNQLTLKLSVLGSTPILSLQPQGGQVNVTCSSCGWRPKPTVKWMSDRTLPAGDLVYNQGPDSLVCVHSWVLLTPSDTQQASCSVSIPGEEKMGMVGVQNFLTADGSGPWKALFAVAVLVSLALVLIGLVLYRRYSGYRLANKDEESLAVQCKADMEDLRKDGVQCKAEMEDLRKDGVRFTLNRSEAPHGLLINKSGTLVRDDPAAAKTYPGPGFPYPLNIPGTAKFTGGRSYWEVKLTAPNIPPKKTWLIGVRKTGQYCTNEKRDLVPSKGYWFLCSDGKDGVHVNTEPELWLPLNPRPEVLGVLLNYEEGKLSFYNAKEAVHLFTMKTKFSGEIEPLFNPGIGDTAPLSLVDLSQEPAEGDSGQATLNPPQEAEGPHNSVTP